VFSLSLSRAACGRTAYSYTWLKLSTLYRLDDISLISSGRYKPYYMILTVFSTGYSLLQSTTYALTIGKRKVLPRRRAKKSHYQVVSMQFFEELYIVDENCFSLLFPCLCNDEISCRVSVDHVM